MTENEKKTTGVLNSTAKLRQLIIDNPDLPLVAFAGETANCGDFVLSTCSDIIAYIGEYLDCCQTVNDIRCYIDRDDFEEDLREFSYDFEGSDAEFETFIENKLLEYEPYWKKCIILCVNN